jgi:predicted choloylglycine hydrolase
VADPGGWRRWLPPGVRELLSGEHEQPAADRGWQEFVPSQWQVWLDASPAPRPQSRVLELLGVDEPSPGPRWQALFDETWPEYRRWWVQHGADARPSRAHAEAALRLHMPELMPVYERMVELAGDDDIAAAMLTLWNPPPFIVACSQAVVPDSRTGEPVLVRNYDYDPRLFEATVHRSRWSTRAVLGTGDCLWGLVDGVNDAGLAVSLTFGGRREVGEGFGVPLVIRYLLEVCDDVAAATEVLARLPHQLSYNVTLCDAGGSVATVMVAPDRPARVTGERQTTNHPEAVEWPEHAEWVGSVERLDLLREIQAQGARSDQLIDAMLAPPLLARRWDEGFATLYTAAYRPVSGGLTYHAPGVSAALSIREPLPEVVHMPLDE